MAEEKRVKLDALQSRIEGLKKRELSDNELNKVAGGRDLNWQEYDNYYNMSQSYGLPDSWTHDTWVSVQDEWFNLIAMLPEGYPTITFDDFLRYNYPGVTIYY